MLGDGETKSKDPRKAFNTAFKQQKLKAWQPILTPKPVIISFLIIGIIFVPIGYVLYDASNKVVEIETSAYQNCNGNSTSPFCTITLKNLNMKAPVYMYYKLENYYQNHRRYVKSRNDAQLRGEVVNKRIDILECSPYAYQDEKNTNPDPSSFYLPCGLIAKSMFNDTFALKHSNGTSVPLSTEGVAWPSDLKDKFKNPPAKAPGIRVIPNFKDIDFIVWMRTAGLPTFRKLYRVINQDLRGDYVIELQNNYPVTAFGGKKFVVLSTTSWLGGKNPFLGYAYMAVGSLCILLAVAFFLKQRISGRQQGDTSYLKWTK